MICVFGEETEYGVQFVLFVEYLNMVCDLCCW